MKISVSYRGLLDSLFGFVLDTEKKTYSTFVINGRDWTRPAIDGYSCPQDDFKMPGVFHYNEKTLSDVESCLRMIERLGFKEADDSIDFGIEGLYYTRMQR